MLKGGLPGKEAPAHGQAPAEALGIRRLAFAVDTALQPAWESPLAAASQGWGRQSSAAGPDQAVPAPDSLLHYPDAQRAVVGRQWVLSQHASG